MKKDNFNKWLIGVDLDGTLLDNNDELTQKNIDVVRRLTHDGHIVSIITGRPFRSSKHIYRQLGLNTIMANHNGAIIHNPKDLGFISNQTGISRKIISDITGEKGFHNNVENFAVETSKKLYILKHDKWLEDFFFIEGELQVEISDSFDQCAAKMEVDPYSMLVLMKSNVSSEEMSRYILNLKNKYGNSIMLRSWQHPNVKNQIVLEVNPVSTDKGHALRKIRNYYNIHSHHTIVFGDGLNDVPMFDEAKHSIVMENANDSIRFFASEMTFKDNHNSGVGDYLEKWFYGE